MENRLGQMLNICHTIKDKIQTNIPNICGDAAEKFHFSRHGHGREDQEMSSFRTFDAHQRVGTSGEAHSEFGECDEYEGKMNGMIGGEGGEFGGEPGKPHAKI